MYVLLRVLYAIIPALLHTAMPTPSLNAVWHSNPYIFYILSEMFFILYNMNHVASYGSMCTGHLSWANNHELR